MLVDKQLPSLVGGVSQQPATVRIASQAEEIVNAWLSISHGAQKRPPQNHIALLTADQLDGAYVHTINRDVQERYTVVFDGVTIRVFDMAGAEKTVAAGGGGAFTYVATSDPRQDISCVTVADYTFVLNRGVIVRQKGTDGAAGSSTDAQPAHHWTMIPSFGGAQSDDPVPFSAGGFRGQRARQNQYVGNLTGALTGTVQTFQDLPVGATSGDIYLLKGSADSAFANYYVRSAGNNVWNETVAPGLRNRIDAETMPHALVRLADGTFEFGPFSWADRKVGDEATNPNPAFVGREIRDIFWYKNRFGVAVDEGVCLTRVGDFGNFYRLTVVDVLDDDRIDVQASETKVTKINYAVPFDSSIILFSDQTQLRLNHGSEALTPSNCTLDVVTNFKMVPNVRPFAVGSDVYFAQDNGNFATIREYFVSAESATNDAANITGHVPRYVPSGINRIGGSDSHDFIMVLPGSIDEGGFNASNEMFLYQFHWVSETEKAQSAWHKWVFSTDCGILSAEVLDSSIVMIVVRAGGTFLESVALPTAASTSFTHMDRGVAASLIGYNAGADLTTWSLSVPFPAGNDRDNFMLVRAADGRLLTDDPANFVWIDESTVGVTGDHPAAAVAGLLYDFRYEFSEQFARNQQEVPMLNGKLLLREWTVSFEDTATFQIDVRPYGVATDLERVVPSAEASGGNLTVGLAHFIANAPVFTDGKHAFGVYGESTEAIVAIVDRSPYSLTFTQAEYEGFYHKRSRTI